MWFAPFRHRRSRHASSVQVIERLHQIVARTLVGCHAGCFLWLHSAGGISQRANSNATECAERPSNVARPSVRPERSPGCNWTGAVTGRPCIYFFCMCHPACSVGVAPGSANLFGRAGRRGLACHASYLRALRMYGTYKKNKYRGSRVAVRLRALLGSRLARLAFPRSRRVPR